MRIFLLIIVIMFTACSDINIFQGSHFTTKVVPQSAVKLTETPIDMVGVDFFVVVDTFLVAQTSSRNDYLLAIYSANTNNLLCRIIGKGKANNEAVNISLKYDCLVDSSGAKIWVESMNKFQMLNITNSVKSGSAMIDREIDLTKLLSKGWIVSGVVNDSTIYGVKLVNFDEQFMTYNLNTDNETQILRMYSLNKSNNFGITSSATKLCHKNGKVASCMTYFNQINVFDLNKNTVPFSFSTSRKMVKEVDIVNVTPFELQSYYIDSYVTENYIFASYLNNKYPSSCNTLHIFDWDGNMIGNLKTDKDFISIAVDEKSNNIYFFGSEERCYMIPLNDILSPKLESNE